MTLNAAAASTPALAEPVVTAPAGGRRRRGLPAAPLRHAALARLRVPRPGGRPRRHVLRRGDLQRPVATQRRASLKGTEPMTINLASAAASCTGTWTQKWNCGWNKPVSPAVAQGGYDFGHSLLPVLVVLARRRPPGQGREEAEEGPVLGSGHGGSPAMTEAARRQVAKPPQAAVGYRGRRVDRAGAGDVPGSRSPDARRHAAVVRRLRGRHAHLRPHPRRLRGPRRPD